MDGYWVALLAAAMWGLGYTLEQRLLVNLQPNKFFFMQSVVVVGLTVMVYLVTKRSLSELMRVDPEVNYKLLVLTMAINIAATLAILISIQSLGAARAALIEISYPIFVVVFSYVIFGQSVNWATLFGGTLIFLGVGIVIVWS
jgi:drug/metabolite transporter (DMT)-like permease